MPVGDAAEVGALTIAELLRQDGFAVDLGYSGNLSRRMRRANRINARVAVLIGEDEISRNVVKVRDLDSGEQSEVPVPSDLTIRMDLTLAELRERLRAFYD